MEHTPPGGAGDGAAAGTGGEPLSIGAVLRVLREEFPEVTLSKIRFLETEGLVEPQRSPSGYRRFSVEDVERLGSVLRMQRDHYLPLRVIKRHLDAVARGERPSLPAQTHRRPGRPGRSRGTAAPSGPRVGRAELLAAAEASESDLAEWESYGLIAPHPDGSYDAAALTVVRIVSDLGGHGIRPRQLRDVKAAADREAGMVDRAVAPLRRAADARTRAAADGTAVRLAALAVQLHASFVQAALCAGPAERADGGCRPGE
ncbi:MerR family transcriptional regulator [Streptomyces sp. HNM0575]|uniref:transcriptional regulator FtsR n=1 Tax=Streptomyces sp. HNM0575 TaxID=2716338 RepID=UPI00145CC89C|nr:MerR family transcriptional regulator [Streptomyces sp. HNM0575]NLU73519.1 MerR family transcriptional regulator [Streptomyces sp. HNM0575]